MRIGVVILGGAAIGAVVGIVSDNFRLWTAIGVAVGVAIGSATGKKRS